MVHRAAHEQLESRSHAGSLMQFGILLSEMPRMMRDVVETILEGAPDLCVVADGVETHALVSRVETDQPDLVMLWADSDSQPAAGSDVLDELLGRFPHVAVVALEDRGQRASIYTTRPRRVRREEISRTQLLAAIRRAAERGR